MKRWPFAGIGLIWVIVASPLTAAAEAECTLAEVQAVETMLTTKTAALRGQDVQAPRGQQDVQAPRALASTGQEVQAPRGQDVQAPRGQDVQAPRGQDVQAPRGQEVQAPRGQDVQAPRGQDVQAPRTESAASTVMTSTADDARRFAATAAAACKAGDLPRARAYANAAMELLRYLP
ncbi:MAG: hypothetical protein HY615_16395 [Candidatus Rokubacteria bacterium]|nr:hypothetical protein [Candidatus Rokubacteria bacterium]